jgi:putative spermidine/putrescine transport system ATP-binding protein
MAIRPEDIRIGKASDGVNGMRGKVELVEYLGREQEAAISIDAQTRLWLRTPEKLTPGDSVELTLPPDKVVLLPRE